VATPVATLNKAIVVAIHMPEGKPFYDMLGAEIGTMTAAEFSVFVKEPAEALGRHHPDDRAAEAIGGLGGKAADAGLRRKTIFNRRLLSNTTLLRGHRRQRGDL
jgi:hypothetical protein